MLGSAGTGNFEEYWDILRNALSDIHTKNASKLAFEALYRAGYKIVILKQTDRLYDEVKAFEEQWFKQQVMPHMRALITSNLVAISGIGVLGATTDERRTTGEKFLRGLKNAYGDHHTSMSLITDVLMYMDRTYYIDNRKVSIFTTAMGLFRDHVLRSKMVQASGELTTFDIFVPVILDQIQMERDGDVIDKNLIKSCTSMLEGLYETDEDKESEKLYLTVFEPQFLAKSQEFYAKECDVLLANADASSWLRQTQKRLTEEADRCRTTISLLTEQKITDIVESEMISRHLQEFIAMEGSGVKAMIDGDRYDDLMLVYQNVSRIDSKKSALKEALSSRIIAHGNEINNTISKNTNFANTASAAPSGDKTKAAPMTAAAQATASAIKWVEEVLVLKDKFDIMWKKCFEEDITIQSTITKAFTEFINSFNRSSEYVSLFIDDHLKRGIKGKSEAEVDIVLDKATTLLRYLTDKDMFERYYKKHLAKRLLHNRSESSDVERQMISRMKMEVGSFFTNKLEGMFKDMTLSEELTSGYRTYIDSLGARDTKHIELGVNILTSNFWPMESMGGGRSDDGTRLSVEWPAGIKTVQDSFKKFYLKERNGRQLTWLGFIGSADIRCTFPKIAGETGVLSKERRHELSVPTYGMLVLLLFNELNSGDTLSFEEIQQRTRIPIADLTRLMTTLAVIPKAKVLNKEPANKTVQPGDKFSFNESFTSKAMKIKVPTIAGGTGVNKVELDAERKDTEERNDEMRGGVIEAAIVRIMKYTADLLMPCALFANILNRQRQELPHQGLIAEVISVLQSRFQPNVNMVKKRIESLIEREYIERIEDMDRPRYRYMA